MTQARLEDVEGTVAQVVRVFHRIRALAEELFGEGETSAGRRGVLRSLDTGGPQTVPALARSRPVSRQYIQGIVNALEANGLVTLADNPVHRRSKLVALTTKGRNALKSMNAQERPVLEAVAARLDGRMLRETTLGLAALRTALDDPEIMKPRRSRR